MTPTGTPSNQRISGYIARLLSQAPAVNVALAWVIPAERLHLTDLTHPPHVREPRQAKYG